MRAQAYLSVPWGDPLGFNFAGLYRKSDGFLRNVPTASHPNGFGSAAQEEINISTKLKFETGEGFTATFAFQYVNLDANGSAWQYVDPLPGAENGNTIEPENVDAYKVGFKTVLGCLRFDASAYYYDYTNLQDQQVQQSDGGLRAIQANVGSAEIYGAEAQIDYTPTDNLSLFAGLAYLHARYKSYPGSAGVVPVPIPNTPLVPWGALPQDLSGREMPRSPKFTFSGGVNYTIDAGNTGSFDLAGSVSYKSSHNPNRSTYDASTGTYLYRQKGFALVNASVTWHSPDDTFEVSVFGRNVFDQKYNAVFDAFSTFGKYRQFGAPASYGVSIGANF